MIADQKFYRDIRSLIQDSNSKGYQAVNMMISEKDIIGYISRLQLEPE